jgi:hypothetical protein
MNDFYLFIIKTRKSIMNSSSQEDVKFWIYEAKRTREFRQKCKKQELSIEQIMKEIDDDHILVQEEPCKRENPRIGGTNIK